ncbi:ketoacyl-ACP synthase III [Aquimarina sp. AD10]|uniref:3-oxoacyl-ACP synthase III family protein n=1 Tax=Aquimarina sp. AD10 TaxID=1714849 RepID=UPI000E51A2B1|nr:3-oxoacyl-ACP synthase III family protein [Aquimarina sp. AD10]AXT62881.1 ketoacyl-ACP synthase III [Aquimarina sp. AD10]RKM94249.1 ketoacyl-ACP synthase III [Aquimarina sp. AD10]
MNIKITGTGSYIPTEVEKNEDFAHHQFFNGDGVQIEHSTDIIIEKFRRITGIEERRYASKQQNTSDLAFLSAQKAIENAKIDPETLDYIIVAHNFGDVSKDSSQADTVPSLASRVKHKLKIKNPYCVAYDLLFGCPGWIEGIIQAQSFIKGDMAKKCLVIGAETLSRVIDEHDRDSMIYSDGAGASILEITKSTGGILSTVSASHTLEESNFLFFGKTYNNKLKDDNRYIKMHGRKIYEFALNHVPNAMKVCIDKTGINIDDISKILIHQANEKMDEAIVKRFYNLYGKKVPEGIMPMSIKKLGNSSVATIPTLYDLILKEKIQDQRINQGDIILFASVGAGMNINAILYQH